MNHKFKLTGIFLLLFTGVMQGQTWQSWNSVGVDIGLSEKLTLEAKELVSFDPSNSFSTNFMQTSLALNYRINSAFTIEGGDQLNIIPGSSRPVRNRVYARGTYTWRFSDAIKSTHAMQVEFHGDNEIRYDQRVIFINGISTRNRLTALNIRPSLSYWLYYNIGGDLVQYYDESGDKVVQQAATGFHRGRLYFSLNSRLTDYLNLSFYLMQQKEFNLFTSEYREINVLNPNTGNIARDFSNYNVVGLSLNFNVGK